MGDIRFEDRGIGIAAQYLPDVFEPFSSWGKFAGLGLGLPYCKAVVEGVGGHISVRSEREQGCKVKISLPIVRGPQ